MFSWFSRSVMRRGSEANTTYQAKKVKVWQNTPMKLNIQRLHPDVKMPCFAHPTDAGIDFFVPETVTIDAGKRKTIPMGVSIEIPEGYVGLFWDKSGLSHKHGIKSFGGVYDPGYSGELFIHLMNFSDTAYTFEKGHKAIQMLVQKMEHPEIVEVHEVAAGQRGAGGIGSTGK